jgi:DNA modification methylase
VKTSHRIYFKNSKSMTEIPPESAGLVVTSPPYPMIEMWDEMFAEQNAAVRKALANSDGLAAFELMHRELDGVWAEIHRILMPGAVACINIGDATRTINNHFALYPNHARILMRLLECGFKPLPLILWRKTTNAPNKFMGSGMLPSGAYVTLEHEYILIVRKGPNRQFSDPAGKRLRRESAFFWEERNIWYSDVWLDLVGTQQAMTDASSRNRSGAFPFELAYRLVNMFSVKGDTVVDPFLGTGTTTWAAAAAARHSVGYEVDPGFADLIRAAGREVRAIANQKIEQRLRRHEEFVQQRREVGKPLKYENIHYGFPVMTRQETELLIHPLEEVRELDSLGFEVTYSNGPQFDSHQHIKTAASASEKPVPRTRRQRTQLKLFQPK